MKTGIISIVLLSLLMAMLVTGFIPMTLNSMGSGEELILSQGDNATFLGHLITSTGSGFLVDGKRIYPSSSVNGVLLVHETSQVGVFRGASVSSLLASVSSSLTPPARIWAEPSQPREGETFQVHTSGSWDDRDSYKSLVRKVLRNGDEISYQSTLMRRFDGTEYDTSKGFEVFGNIDNRQLIVRPLILSGISAGDIEVVAYEYYSRSPAVQSPSATEEFSIFPVREKDSTAPIIESAEISPSSFGDGDVLLFSVETSDPESGISKVVASWYDSLGAENNVALSNIPGTLRWEVKKGYNAFPYGNLEITFTAYNGAGRYKKAFVSVTHLRPDKDVVDDFNFQYCSKEDRLVPVGDWTEERCGSTGNIADEPDTKFCDAERREVLTSEWSEEKCALSNVVTEGSVKDNPAEKQRAEGARTDWRPDLNKTVIFSFLLVFGVGLVFLALIYRYVLMREVE
jgi:hypothetical protein